MRPDLVGDSDGLFGQVTEDAVRGAKTEFQLEPNGLEVR
jgi:hypothetical protein